VLRHKFSHPVHDVVFPLGLDCLLVVLEFPRKQVGLSVLELDSLLLSLFFVDETGYFQEVLAGSVLDVVGVDKPNIICVIPDELAFHLENFLVPNFLHVVSHFETLDVGVSVELTCFQKLEFVHPAKSLKIDLFLGVFLCGIVDGSTELYCDAVTFSVLGRGHCSLNIVDHFGLG
jgi:hypothetical protein